MKSFKNDEYQIDLKAKQIMSFLTADEIQMFSSVYRKNQKGILISFSLILSIIIIPIFGVAISKKAYTQAVMYVVIYIALLIAFIVSMLSTIKKDDTKQIISIITQKITMNPDKYLNMPPELFIQQIFYKEDNGKTLLTKSVNDELINIKINYLLEKREKLISDLYNDDVEVNN